MKRYRTPKTKPGQLRVYYGRVDGDAPDVVFAYGGGGADKCDSALLHYYLGSKRLEHNFDRAPGEDRYKYGPSLIEELERRGYDMDTLKFSIEKKRQPSQVTDDAR